MKNTLIKLSAFSLVCLVGLSACDYKNKDGVAENEIDQAVVNAETEMYKDETSAGISDKTGVKVEDAMITTKIKAAFLAESAISSMDINVTTIDGVVMLTGSADSLASSQKATEVARQVAEVKQVNNQLVIN
ncbi:MAG: BON domain-containing protein [Methylophilus sp.]|nr:BON domain-containing protein [Methylophilus sp.]